jgi:hypothetical protein
MNDNALAITNKIYEQLKENLIGKLNAYPLSIIQVRSK